MAKAVAVERAYRLTLPGELIIMLLNEQTGYFHQVPGWELNCAVVGAVLTELSLRSRIDTDMESLILVDRTETGNPVLDPILKQIADAQKQPFAAIGMGKDLRFEGEELTGGALEVDDQCVHLCAFRLDDENDGQDDTDQGRERVYSTTRRTRIRRNLDRRN